MVRAGRIVLLAVLGALIFAASAGGQTADQKAAAVDPYWFGPYFAGMQVTEEEEIERVSVIYGDCKLPEGEGGCSYPAEVRTETSCATNPIAYGSSAGTAFLLRGGGLATVDSELGQVEVGTGNRTVVVATREPELMSAALREVRRRSQPAPEPLPPPVYPPAVLRELKRVTAPAERHQGVKAIADETGLTPDEVRFRLRVAELLGPDALAGVAVPTISTKRVDRLIGMAVNARGDAKRTADKNDLTVAQLQKLISQVRGLTGFC